LPDSAIGELAAFARRSGATWFLAAMCGPKAKTLRVPLSFLGDGQYQASLVRDDLKDDAKDGAAVVVESTTQKSTDSLTVDLRPGGGFVGRFSRK
jgi:alpha-glucosidase